MDLTRRNFAGGLMAGGLVLGASPVWALTNAQAETLVTSLVADINKTIASGKSEAAMIRDFERIFRRYGDIPAIASVAMGVDARRASNAQRKAFSNAFTGYISRKYGKRFREFIGGRLEIQGTRPARRGIEVVTTAFLRGEAPFEVSFVISDARGKPLFFNMFIEGIDMLLTERTEIGAMIDKRRGDIDAMINDLKKAG